MADDDEREVDEEVLGMYETDDRPAEDSAVSDDDRTDESGEGTTGDTAETDDSVDGPTDSEAGTDTPDGRAETDTPDGRAETDTPDGRAETDRPGGEAETDTPGGEAETDTPDGEAGTDTPGGEAETDTLGGEAETDTPDGEAEEPVGMYEQSDEGGFVSSEETVEDESDGADESESPRFDAPTVSEDSGPPETASGTFYVKYAEDTAMTLHEVDTGQIFTVIENPGIETHEIIEASLVAQPPMEVSYLVDDLDAQYSIPVERSDESPTQTVRELAEELDTGESVPINRKGDGEIHILQVDPDETERIVEELPEDELTHKNAARYDEVERVEIRSDAAEGLVSVRYLP